MIQSELKSVGIQITPQNLSNTTFLSDVEDGHFDLAYDWDSSGPGPYYELRQLLYSGMRFVVRRFGFFLFTLWAAVSFNFLIPRLMPGNPVQALEAQHPHLGPQAVHALTVLLGGNQDQSFVSQYFEYWKHVVTFNFGISITASFGTSVRTMVLHALPWTLGLVGVTTIVAFAVGTLIGLVSAWRRGGWLDSALPPIFVITSAFPYFWIALLASISFPSGWASCLRVGPTTSSTTRLVSTGITPAMC